MKCNGYAASYFALKSDVPASVDMALSLRAVQVKTEKQWLNHSLPAARKRDGNFRLYRWFTKPPRFICTKWKSLYSSRKLVPLNNQKVW
jgi:hypothetical protein